MRKQLEESDHADLNIIEAPIDPDFSRAAKATASSVTARSPFRTRLYHSHPCVCPGVTLPPPFVGSYRLLPCNRTFCLHAVVPALLYLEDLLSVSVPDSTLPITSCNRTSSFLGVVCGYMFLCFF